MLFYATLSLIKTWVAALVAYEYMITIRQEVETMWMRKWTAATWLFLVNRYLMITYTVIQGIPTYTSLVSCCLRTISGPS